jgi:hypothetical protein
MKRMIFILIILTGAPVVSAQDLLVTNRHDTLNCTIGKLENDCYPISFIMDDTTIYATIHRDSVLLFRKNVFRGRNDNRLRPWYPLIDLGIDAGAAHQFGTFRVDDDLTGKSAFGARTGYYAGVDLMFFHSRQIGYGLKYNYRSLLDGDLVYQYAGPVIMFRFWDKRRKNNLFFSLSGGYGWMVQKNAPIQNMLVRPRIEMHANAISGDISAGYNRRLSKHVSARIKVSCIIGYPGFIKIIDIGTYTRPSDAPLEIGDYCNNMNTVNISAGFTFHK